MSGRRRLGQAAALALLLAGCDQSMSVQPKNKAYSSSTLWPDGTSARPIPAHAVARGDLARDTATATPPPVTAELMARGRERYEIYCTPCHGLSGRGDGMIVQRGFPPPPDYASPRLRAASAQHIFDVITNGYGVMYSYAARVEPADRWAIVAYVRALQTATAAEPDAASRDPSSTAAGRPSPPGEKQPTPEKP